MVSEDTVLDTEVINGGKGMKSYEVFLEEVNPCGGEDNLSKREFIEVEAEDPETYVKENGRFPIQEIDVNDKGETVIHTGDGHGYFIRYTFTEV
jgi:hypothetical protein